VNWSIREPIFWEAETEAIRMSFYLLSSYGTGRGTALGGERSLAEIWEVVEEVDF
jgi:hypothetical protein